MFWSVIVPTTGPAPFLDQALLSVQRGLKGDGEILLRHNPGAGSKLDVLSHPLMESFSNQVDRGCYGSVNDALKDAKGDWVHVLHDDDWVLTDFYDEMRNAIRQKFPPGTVAASCLYGNYDHENGELTRPPWTEYRQSGVVTDWVRDSLTRGNPFQVCSVVFHRGAALWEGGFREDMPYAADWEFYARLARRGEWGHVARDLARYRVHRGQRAWAMLKDGRAAQDCRLARQLATQYFKEKDT